MEQPFAKSSTLKVYLINIVDTIPYTFTSLSIMALWLKKNNMLLVLKLTKY